MRRVILAAALTVTSVARAADAPVEDLSEPEGLKAEPFAGFSGGGGFSIAKHPMLNQSFGVPMVTLSAGVLLDERWSIALEVAGTARYVRRSNLSPSESPSIYVAAASCTSCAPKDKGGILAAITASFTAVGPRADFAPFGINGPYAGVGIGIAWIQGLPAIAPAGAAASARVGFRYRFFKNAEVAAELGAIGHIYPDAWLVTPFATANVRLYI